ncbi:GF13792 gene product from transcript GF13792-RA [Rhizoctonia solani]|uniref:GF13792 gene product from transcript GF13792-RA n=1 Tax=Rhizoctonia solani TaxID=456999 RepID=A0A0K6G984_9AGAM|nr:GF13792 gene product from transcript GF13792-RA [Rhizoctonia solani]
MHWCILVDWGLKTLAPHVARVKQLWIQTASVHTESFLKSISKSSQLERLVVTGRYTDDHPLELSPSLLPRLRHLSLTHAFLAPSPVPTNLLSLSLKPPPGAPPLALSALATLLQASPNLTDLALFGNAVPVYKPGDPQHERTDLLKLKTLKVAGVNPVQAAWLLFHLSHPSGTLLTLDLEPSRPLRTLAFDRPRAPDFTRPRAPGELESYYAVLTMFRSGAIPLDTISIGPAVSEGKQQQIVEVKPSSESKQPLEQEEEIITEKLAAQYTSSSSMLSLAAGSRATESLARVLTTPVPSVAKLCITSVKLGLERLEEIKRGEEDECQIRTLEIRACSLPVLPKGERRTNESQDRTRTKGGPPPTPSQTSPTSGQNAIPSVTSPPLSNTNLIVPSNGPNGFSNPYSSTGFPTSSSSSPTPTNPPIPTPGPQPNLPIWTPYTVSHELVTPTSAGAFMPFYAGARFANLNPNANVNSNANGTGSNGDTLNSPASSEGDTTTTDTAVPDEGLDASTLNPDLSSSNLSGSVHSASGDTTLASIASSEDANHVLDDDEEEIASRTPDQGDETGSEISDTDAVVNLNASETVGDRRRSSLPTRTRPGKLRDEIVAKLRDDVMGKLRDDIMGKLKEDKARASASAGREEGSDKNAGSTIGTVGTGSGNGSGTSTPLVFATPATQLRGLSNGTPVNGASAGQVNGTSNNAQVNGSKPPLPNATSAPLLSTTSLPPINASQQPQLSRVATAPQLDQLRLKSNYLRPSNSSSNLRRPLGFASYATSVAVTGFATDATITTTTTKPTPSRSPTFPFPNQPSFHTLQHPDDPDIRLLTVLSFHMPQLEELRIIRSTIRGNALIKFIESRNNCVEDESDSDSEGARAGPGTPILMLELVECPYVSAEHVRVLRESVDDVRWKAYTYVGGAGGV